MSSSAALCALGWSHWWLSKGPNSKKPGHTVWEFLIPVPSLEFCIHFCLPSLGPFSRFGCWADAGFGNVGAFWPTGRAAHVAFHSHSRVLGSRCQDANYGPSERNNTTLCLECLEMFATGMQHSWGVLSGNPGSAARGRCNHLLSLVELTECESVDTLQACEFQHEMTAAPWFRILKGAEIPSNVLHNYIRTIIYN